MIRQSVVFPSLRTVRLPIRHDSRPAKMSLRAHALPLAVMIALGVASASAADTSSEASLAAYADAANFQTNGAIGLAIDAWNKFLDRFPNDPLTSKAAHYLGVCYMQKDPPDYPAAADAFERALKDRQYELREESLANRGWCLFAAAGSGPQRDRDKLQQAWDVFESLRQEHPESRFLDRALFYCGEAAYGLGKPERAVEYYNELLSMSIAKDSPLRCDALYARGVALEELDRFDDAFASYNQLLSGCDAVDLVTDVRLRVGDLKIMREDYDQAIESFAKVFASEASDEDRSYALFRQAFALVRADRPSEAARLYEQLLQEFPQSSYAGAATLAAAQSTYRGGDIDEAARRFRRVLEQNNSVAATEAAHWLSRIAISQGKPADAVEVARRQMQRGLEGEFAADLRFDLAEALSMQPATLEESLSLFEQIYRESPDDPLAPRALYNAAFSALQVDRPQQAVDFAGEFIQRFPDDTLAADVRFVAAEGHRLLGHPRQAVDAYVDLLAATEPDNAKRPVWVLRAAAAFNAAGDYDRTVELLEKEIDAIADPEPKTEAHLLAGQALLKSGKPERAATSFQAARQADPIGPRAEEASLMAGQAQLVSGRQSDAVDTWKELVRVAPQSPMADQARYKLGQIANSDGQYGRAAELFDEILRGQREPELTPYALYGKGYSLLQQGQFDDALKALDRMLDSAHQRHPLRNEALLARGIAHRNLGNADRARQDLDDFLASDPRGTGLGHALYESALIDQQAKAPAGAAQKLTRLVDQVPDYPEMEKVLYELGWSLQESGDDDGAVERFKTLVESFPESELVCEAAYFVGQRFYVAEDWDSAASYFATAAESSADADLSEKALYRLGWSHFKAGDFQSAESAFARLAQRHPDGTLAFDATMMVGECRFKRSEYEQALAGFRIARDKLRANQDRAATVRDAAERQVRELALLHGGQSAAQLKMWDEAIQWYQELRERFPASDYLPQTFYETGFAYQQKDDQEQALKFYGEVADHYRNELAARARFMMGEIYFAQRRFDQAIPEFQRVMFGFGAEDAPPSIKNWQAKSGFEAARCSELLAQQASSANKREKALNFSRDFYSYVLQKHPQHELAPQSRDRLEALQK